MKGKIRLNYDEKFKMIKCFNNILYIVIEKDGYFTVFKINGEYEKEFVYSVTDKSNLTKPIL